MSRIYRGGNKEVRTRAGIEWELASRADQRVLRWFGHVERIDGQKGVDGGSKRGSDKRWTEVNLDEWCEGGLGQQMNDGGDYATMLER